MNWIHFLLWLAGIYFLYYLIIVLLDIAGSRHPQTTGGAAHELTFSEQVTPHDAASIVQEAHAQAAIAQQPASPEMIASGGVPLKDVFSLARKEAIVYLKEVAFN